MLKIIRFQSNILIKILRYITYSVTARVATVSRQFLTENFLTLRLYFAVANNGHR